MLMAWSVYPSGIEIISSETSPHTFRKLKEFSAVDTAAERFTSVPNVPDTASCSDGRTVLMTPFAILAPSWYGYIA